MEDGKIMPGAAQVCWQTSTTKTHGATRLSESEAVSAGLTETDALASAVVASFWVCPSTQGFLKTPRFCTRERGGAGVFLGAGDCLTFRRYRSKKNQKVQAERGGEGPNADDSNVWPQTGPCLLPLTQLLFTGYVTRCF